MPTYFCFIESDVSSTPHMEPLDAATEDEARAQAQILLQTHASGVAVTIVLDEVEIATLHRATLPGRSPRLPISADQAESPPRAGC